jgi:hypothetical protein
MKPATLRAWLLRLCAITAFDAVVKVALIAEKLDAPPERMPLS